LRPLQAAKTPLSLSVNGRLGDVKTQENVRRIFLRLPA
jgi:hypothetical protein